MALYCVVATACAISYLVLRRSVACHHEQDPELRALHASLTRKNQTAIAIYMASVVFSFVWVPAALLLVALPALMYFRPDPRVEHHASGAANHPSDKQ